MLILNKDSQKITIVNGEEKVTVLHEDVPYLILLLMAQPVWRNAVIQGGKYVDFERDETDIMMYDKDKVKGDQDA